MADPRVDRPGAAAEQPVFYYDLVSPEAYLAAERINAVLPVVPEWEPIALSRLPGGEAIEAWRCAEEREIAMQRIERRAAELEMPPLRWPAAWPGDTERAMLAATYAKHIGRAVAFSLAAFRQAFAAARDLAEINTILIAAAACEMHPSAVLKGVELRSVREGLDAATARAAELGARTVPTVRVGDELFPGDRGLEAAATALRTRAPA